MVLSVAVTAGLLLQATGNAQLARAAHAPPAPPPDPVRVWRADSTAFVRLGQAGHLVVLNVDAIGRITVLFPLAPYDSTAVSANAPVAVDLPPEAQGNPATFVAVRSRWPFDFETLRSGIEWNYYGALLLQPTAGDPLAALLDIADRITDGRPYDYGVVTYSREGTAVARGPVVTPQVCLSCVRHGAPADATPAVATNSVDCSNASLTNAFCGINSGSVSITSEPAPPPEVVYQPAPAPVYVPYYVPLVVHEGRRRFERVSPLRIAVPRSSAAAYPIAPHLTVPSGAQLRSFAGRRH